ncbi:hypothetical protein DIURU_000349 [Diutina rugosa]|uniref:Uncharacterized protein n=1 Tax=Diutina rugosa TaxID=5481 RepID=A0A642UYW1_DIURU|nr:uncharacterized protein DIURU_000349 [Diutina rugosa]KAA8907939.1 hypothetical protein DIURU_000349 [Diutina rugosa]
MSTLESSLIQGAILVDTSSSSLTTTSQSASYFSDLRAMTSVGTTESALANNITTAQKPGSSTSGSHTSATSKWGIITVTVLVSSLICAV